MQYIFLEIFRLIFKVPVNTNVTIPVNTNYNTNVRISVNTNDNANVTIPVNTNVRIPVNTNDNANVPIPVNTNDNTNVPIPVNTNEFKIKIKIKIKVTTAVVKQNVKEWVKGREKMTQIYLFVGSLSSQPLSWGTRLAIDLDNVCLLTKCFVLNTVIVNFRIIWNSFIHEN